MVDKQFALKSDELIPVTRAVQRNELTTFMLYPWRHHPAAIEIRRLIEEDVLGKPIDIESRQFWGQVGGPLGKDIDAPAHRLDTEGGGVLHYIGCHHLDLMRAVMGCEVKSVQAMTGRPFGHMEEPMEDIIVLALEYENGGFGSLHNGYTKPITVGDQGYDSAFVLRGVNGWAEWTPVGGNKLQVTSASPQWKGAPEKTIGYELTPMDSIVSHVWYYIWIEQFIEDIRAGRPGVPNMVDGLHVLQSIDAAYESARTGTRIAVKYGVDV
jgi:predicted dehydrogenase